MDFIANMLAAPPSGMWESIIRIFSGVGSYALAIILLTFCIKIIMLPLDFFNKRISSKQMVKQAALKDDMDAIKKKYKDQAIQNQKINELYKKNNFNPMGSCVFMLINLVLVMAIFFTLLGGMNNMASYKIIDQYEKLQITYISVSDKYDEETFNGLDEAGKILFVNTTVAEINEDPLLKEQANVAVKARYAEVKESFLWIKNIWLADSPLVNEIPSFDSYASVARLTKEQKEDEINKTTYETIMSPLSETQGVNGYFILVILAAGTAFLYQFLMMRKNSKKNPGGAGQTKFMLILFPILMGLFTLMYNAIFALYIIASQVVGILTVPLMDLINDKIDKKKQQKESEKMGRIRRI